jgi:hypothetical protein
MSDDRECWQTLAPVLVSVKVFDIVIVTACSSFRTEENDRRLRHFDRTAPE